MRKDATSIRTNALFATTSAPAPLQYRRCEPSTRAAICPVAAVPSTTGELPERKVFEISEFEFEVTDGLMKMPATVLLCMDESFTLRCELGP
jgi:hypothetical protein